MKPPGKVGLVATTLAGRRHAAALATALPGAVSVEGPVREALGTAWRECEAVVVFLATGAAVRLLAPLLADPASDKRTDPPVVAVDEAARFAVVLTGAHHGGNELAADVAVVLGATPVVTTATDAAGVPGLDTLGWPVEGDLAAVTRAVLDGAPVRLDTDAVHPLPALPANVTPGAREAVAAVRITDRLVPAGDVPTVTLRPPTLVVGVGASRGAPALEVVSLVERVLAGAGLAVASVAALATADVKRDEPGIVEAAHRFGVPLVPWPAGRLAAVGVPNPSEVVRAAVGTPSVAEAAAVLGTDGRGRGDLVVGKTVSAAAQPMATAAVARHAPRGRLTVVGLGPGARDLLAPRAREALRAASVVVGLDQYVDQVRDLLRPGTRVLATGLGAEEERARSALDEARAGHAVALVGSGDAQIYAMASPALDVADGDLAEVDVDVVPGVTAGLAAGAVLGAPLGHDHAYVSLSDLHTPWEAIERRVRAAAEGDFVVLFYNPRSRARHWQLDRALDVLREHRPPGTPVGVVRDAARPGQTSWTASLAGVDTSLVDMSCLVVVGASTTRVVDGLLVTPRGYSWKGLL